MGKTNLLSFAKGWKQNFPGRRGSDPNSQKPESDTSSIFSRGMWNPRRSVGMKLFIFFFISAVLFVGAVGLFSYNASKQLIQEEVSRFSMVATQQAGDKLRMIFSQYEELSMRFLVENALQDQVLSMLNAKEGTYERLQAYQELQDTLTGMSFSNSTIRGITMFDGNGKLML